MPGHAGVLRRIVADGGELGLHTYTHSDLASVPAWREHLELDATQLEVAAAVGYRTDLLRLPYSSTVTGLTSGEWQAVTRAGRYRAVFTDLDTKDWSRPGVQAIVRAATPRHGAGAIVMMHDGGGDRSQTVAALERLIPRLRARGYRFETVSHAIGVASPWSPAGLGERLRGSVLSATVVASRWFVAVLSWLFIVVGTLAVLRTIVLMLFARRHSLRPPTGDGPLPPVSVLVPAYNEEAGIAACVRSLAASDYPEFEIVVVDDGSSDGTLEEVARLALPAVRAVRQENAGKPAALTTGLGLARHDVLVMVDGDTVFEPGTLRALVAPLLADQRGMVGAVSGNAKVGNRRGLLGRWQHIEYVIGFNLDRRMFDALRCMPTVPGAVGAFRRSALETVGGVSDDTLAEDTDLTMAICRAGFRVLYAPEAVAWTEAPTNLTGLWRQRYRWCYGTLQAMWKHRAAVLQRGPAGAFGRRGLPYLLLFQVALPLLAPVVDVAAVAQLLSGHARVTVIAWLAFFVVQLVSGLYAFRLDGERPGPLWSLILQQFVYRQLMYLVVIQSVVSVLAGSRLRWQKLERTGRLDAAPAPEEDDAPVAG